MMNWEQLSDFFKNTYVEKVAGNWDNKKKFFVVPGYINGWEMFHFHHVCIRSGSDGMYVGLDGVENHWERTNQRILLPPEWNKYAKIRGLLPFFLHRIQQTTQLFNVTTKIGSTWFQNCFHQREKSANPAHWMMKLGVWYEIALCQSYYNQSNIFQNTIKLPYDHVQMSQCPSLQLSDWKWGVNLWHVVKRRSDLALMTGSNTLYDNIGYQLLDEVDPTQLLCFEDIYFSARMGLWIQGRRNLVEFRRDTVSIAGEPIQAETNPEELLINDRGFDVTALNQNSRMHYCDADGEKTSARIKIFQRSSTIMLRRFLNLDEVVNLAQSYTKVTVEVITVNESTPVAEQIRVFNTFDILITSHGR